MTESQVSKEIMFEINRRSDIRIFRNNVGVAYQGTPVEQTAETVKLKKHRMIRYGLRVGSGDWIGIRKVKITPDMVGREIGQFVSLEIKTKTGRERKEQTIWKAFIKKMCGVAETVRSVEDAKEVLGG